MIKMLQFYIIYREFFDGDNKFVTTMVTKSQLFNIKSISSIIT